MSRHQASTGSDQGVQKKIRLSIHDPWESNKQNLMLLEKLNQEQVRYDSEEGKRKAARKPDRSKIISKCRICGKNGHFMQSCPYIDSCPRDANVCHGVDIVSKSLERGYCAVLKECWTCGTVGDHWETECPNDDRNKQQPAAIEK